jgi:hypothetical protein
MQFNILTDSVFVSQPKLDSSMIPAIATNLITEDVQNYITEDSSFLIVET